MCTLVCTVRYLIHKEGSYFLCTLFNTASFHCVGGCWDRTQDYWNFGIDIQML
jgi:hypothetical protein